MQKKYLVAIVVLIVILGASFLVYDWYKNNTIHSSEPVPLHTTSTVPADSITITLTKDGFVPDTLTIKKGQKVTFVTTTGSMFWPASNLHPSHLLYPEFDPLNPIAPDQVWTFTFEKVGEWKFHDHLAPYFTGVITVTE